MPEGDARTTTPPIAGLLAVFLAMLVTGPALATAFVPGPFVPAGDADRSAAALALRDAVATVVAAEGARRLSGPPWKEEAAEYMGAAVSQAFDALLPEVARAAAGDIAILCRAHSRLSATVARDYPLPGWAKARCAEVRGAETADRVLPVRELGAYRAGAVPAPDAGVFGTPGTRSRARDSGEEERGVTGAGATGSYVPGRAPGTRAAPEWALSDPAVSLDPGEPVRVARDALTLDALLRLHRSDLRWSADTTSGWWALEPSLCEEYRVGAAALPAAAGPIEAGMRPGEAGSPLCFAATRPDPGGRAYAGTVYARAAGRSTLVLFHAPNSAPSSPTESFHPHEGLRVVARGLAEALGCGGPSSGDRTIDCRAVTGVASAPGARGAR